MCNRCMLIIVPFSILLSLSLWLPFSCSSPRFQKTDVDFMNRFYAHKFCQEMLIGLLLSNLLFESILLSFLLIWHVWFSFFAKILRFFVSFEKKGENTFTQVENYYNCFATTDYVECYSATIQSQSIRRMNYEIALRSWVGEYAAKITKNVQNEEKWCAFLWVLWVTALWQWIFTHSFALLRQCAFVSTFNGCNQPTDERTNEPGEWMNLRQIVFINPQNKFSKKNHLNDAHCISDYTSVCTRCPIQFVVYLHFNLSCIECTDHITFLC